MNATQSHVGDSVQAQITRDVKEGKQTVIKKGAVIGGKIVMAQPYHETMTRIGIVFDQVTAKDGPQFSTHLKLRAVAPPPDQQSADTIKDGRGNEATNITATARGGLIAGGGVGELTPTSQGVYGLPGLNLAFEQKNGELISLITATGANLHLQSGSQAVFEVSAE